MRSSVYFIKVNDLDTLAVIKEKFSFLIHKSKVFDFIKSQDSVAVKLHFGEEGNTGFVRPEFVKIAIDKIIEKGASPVLTDTNTLYRSKRISTQGHLQLAQSHGFTQGSTGAQVLIAEDTAREVRVNGKFIKIAKIASLFTRADALVAITHFKGHMLTGFGGSLKNIGMGCAVREGKLQQHSDLSPKVNMKNCTGCAECEKACPAGAIVIINKKSILDSSKCIGCASCIAVCKFNAMDVNWEAGGINIQEKMAEYAKAALLGKEKKCAFINFAIKITKECDCLAKDDPKISPDIGLFASKDPVSIDKASLDLVLGACGRDIFKEAHPLIDGSKQLQYAAGIGLGNLEYELIEA